MSTGCKSSHNGGLGVREKEGREGRREEG